MGPGKRGHCISRCSRTDVVEDCYNHGDYGYHDIESSQSLQCYSIAPITAVSVKARKKLLSPSLHDLFLQRCIQSGSRRRISLHLGTPGDQAGQRHSVVAEMRWAVATSNSFHGVGNVQTIHRKGLCDTNYMCTNSYLLKWTAR